MLLNPAAGRGRGRRSIAAITAAARRHGIEVEVPESAADLTACARRAAGDGIERLLVGGGDGTWHQAARGLAGSACALAPIALGTGNDLARELGFPLDPIAAIGRAVEGPVTRIDLGRAGEGIFCGVAGSGFDSQCAEYAKSVRRLRGPLVYVWSVIRVLARFTPLRATLDHDGGRFEGEVMFVSLANTRWFGGGMHIAPHADATDGLLDVVIVHRVSRLRLLSVFPRVYSGRHLTHPAVSILRTSRARLAFDRPSMLYGDGEAITPVPMASLSGDAAGGLAVSLEPKRLAVVRSQEGRLA
ncbi:MAG: diacylglycerol kinase family lipid kinase [Thermoanaerobaculia bacterium]|nr:diacylglycerol kinase family lipid kinase [Thermoanaerobaculia bacterium]